MSFQPWVLKDNRIPKGRDIVLGKQLAYTERPILFLPHKSANDIIIKMTRS